MTDFVAQAAVGPLLGKINRKWKPCCSKVLYRERILVERVFTKLEHFRCIAARYDDQKIILLNAGKSCWVEFLNA